MLISHSKKFIFFHNSRTGGNSVKTLLIKYCHFDLNKSNGKRKINFFWLFIFKFIKRDIKNNDKYQDLSALSKLLLKGLYTKLTWKTNKEHKNEIRKIIDNPNDFYHIFTSFINPYFPCVYSTFGHISANHGQKKIPQSMFNTYFKFGFVRDPISWIISYYHYLKYSVKYDGFENYESINHYLEHLYNNRDKYIGQDLTGESPQYNFFHNENGQLLLDHLGFYEKINDDWIQVSKSINLNKIQLPLKNNFKFKEKNSDNLLSEKSKEIICFLFKKDFVKYGYEQPCLKV